MKTLLTAAAVALLAVTATPASASPVCEAQVTEMQAAWKTVPHPYSKMAERKTRGDHDHNAMAETYMYGQLRQAEAQCKGGNDHEALLRLDVVRVWLKLPEIAHPAEHNYQSK
jgi:hypothetical protein